MQGVGTTKEGKWLYPLLGASIFTLLLMLVSSSRSSSSLKTFRGLPNHLGPKLLVAGPSPPSPPSLAYFITGSNGEAQKIFRLLLALYHPNNHYLLHLDLSATAQERRDLAIMVRNVPAFVTAQNINVVGKADFANHKGSSAVASTLHGAALLLRYGGDWDWFINLSASEYPLVTQDDLLHILSFLPRNLNFIQLSSQIGKTEYKMIRPVIVDPGLYLSSGSDIFYATQKRPMPNAYKIFTGSASIMLSRKFIEFCIMGIDNSPRTLLMYFSNSVAAQEAYFQTVICNVRKFNTTIVNDDMHYAAWDKPKKLDPRTLSSNDFDEMIKDGAPFARNFNENDPVLDHIDREVLHRGEGKIVPGGWCIGEGKEDPCSVWGDVQILKPGPGAKRLEGHLVKMFSNSTFRSNRCIFE
ncbi:hypothetical protein AMTRI_Chr07g77120 [Amborella trichopoda]|uniref:beta-glucuronosyltransferase GlcAT14B n=1 Tax=Amborella trichopoda TaxID=13333 RepID=UPI0005D2ED91|nr:beta-glucuronosyltransferase GlcAT14B [Amborella trichopoda]|eukprot:XP_011627025.1 beta-glucuronosyltransferase GlcAT14B [Amborella trichopoda]